MSGRRAKALNKSYIEIAGRYRNRAPFSWRAFKRMWKRRHGN